MSAARFAIVVLVTLALSSCVDFDHAEKVCEDGGRCALDCCIEPSLCGPVTLLNATRDATNPQGIAVNASAIYWLTDDGMLRRSALDGGGATALVLGSYPGRRLILDSTFVSWVAKPQNGNSGSVNRCLLDGGGWTQVVPTDQFLGGPTESDAGLLWVENNLPYELPNGGGAPLKLSADITDFGTVVAMAADTQNLYLGQAGKANRIARFSLVSDAGYRSLAANHVVVDLAFDGTHLYWLDQVDGGAFEVFSMLPDGGSPLPLASVSVVGTEKPQSIAVDPSGLYWTVGGGTTQTGRLMALGLDGGAPRCVQSSLASPFRLALDGQSIYWTDDTQGAVFSTPKR